MRKYVFVILLFSVPSAFINAQFKKEMSVDSFSKLKLLGAAKWELVPASEERIVVDATNDEMFDYIEIDNIGNLLVIGITDKNENLGKLFSSMTFYVYYEKLEAVELNGAGSVSTKGKINSTSLSVELSGTGNMFIKTQCENFEADMNGAGKMEIIGETKLSKVSVQGVGTYEARQLRTEVNDVMVSGVGNAYVHAEKSLTAQINGVGKIKFLGSPAEKNFKTNGIGSIKPF